MKNILLLTLLFIPLFCNSQEIVVSPIFNPNNDKIVTLYYQDYHLERATDSLKVVPLITFKNYLEECSKDTCWVTYDQWYQGKIPCILGNGDYDIIEEKYNEELQRTLFLVRRTPTLEGFIKYLEE